MAEIIEWGGGVLLRQGRQMACFLPAEMRLFNVDAPEDQPLLEVAAELAARYTTPYSRSRTLPLPPQASRPGMLPILGAEAGTPRLSRLTLHVSNLCNMACSYCYAGQGSYNMAEGLMSPETARDLLRRSFTLYPRIDVIHFFGGEPLLNLRTIEAAATFVTQAASEGLLEQMPRFAVTTNGTLATDDVIEALQHWDIGLTVSWDGTRPAQDHCRPLRTGGSSYEVLADSLSRLRYANIPFEIECTYNRYHQQLGIPIRELMEFFFEQTGHRYLHIAPAFLPPDSAEAPDYAALAEDYRDAARFSVENLLKGSGPVLRFVERVAGHLASRRPAEAYCPAFFSQLTVALDGTVYPCFMMTGRPEFEMGNLMLGSYPGERSVSVLSRYFDEFYQRENPWYAALTEGCIAGEMLVSGNLHEPVMAPVQKAIAEECLLGLATQMGTHTEITAG